MMRSLFGSQPTGQRSISYQDVWGKGDYDWHEIAKSPVGKALAIGATLACVDIKAASIMAMPLQQFTQPATGPATKTARTSPLLVDPSEMFSLEEWVYAAVSSATLWDETIGIVVRTGGNGMPEQVEWLCPDDVSQTLVRGRIVYMWQGVEHTEWRHGGDIIHIRRRPLPGKVHGMNTAKAVEPLVTAGIEGARALFATYLSGGMPPAVMQWEGGELEAPEAATISERFVSWRRRNVGRPLVIGKGWSFTPVPRQDVIGDISAVRRQIATEIANAHGVPPALVGGDSGGSMTYSNLEGLTRHLEARTLLPDYTLLERALTRLLPNNEFCRFNADAIVRVSLNDRIRSYDVSLRNGSMNRNEVRDLEDRGEIPDGDVYLWPPYRAFPISTDDEREQT